MELDFGFWTHDWLWNVPLVGAWIILHAVDLGAVAWLLRQSFAAVIGTTMLLAVLHGFEAALWDAAPQIVGTALGPG